MLNTFRTRSFVRQLFADTNVPWQMLSMSSPPPPPPPLSSRQMPLGIIKKIKINPLFVSKFFQQMQLRKLNWIVFNWNNVIILHFSQRWNQLSRRMRFISQHNGASASCCSWCLYSFFSGQSKADVINFADYWKIQSTYRTYRCALCTCTLHVGIPQRWYFNWSWTVFDAQRK